MSAASLARCVAAARAFRLLDGRSARPRRTHHASSPRAAGPENRGLTFPPSANCDLELVTVQVIAVGDVPADQQEVGLFGGDADPEGLIRFEKFSRRRPSPSLSPSVSSAVDGAVRPAEDGAADPVPRPGYGVGNIRRYRRSPAKPRIDSGCAGASGDRVKGMVTTACLRYIVSLPKNSSSLISPAGSAASPSSIPGVSVLKRMRSRYR